MADIKYIVNETLKWEGGLSNATTDTASKSPSPYVYNGVTGWHTNKGITYSTFKEASKTLGFEDNADNFLKMPNDIWMKIAKNMYWDKLHLDEVKSQAIANLLFSWTWASGYGWRNRVQSYLKSKGVTWNTTDYAGLPAAINGLTDKYGEKPIADDLFDQYREFYKSLNQPVYLKGWLNRLDSLQNYSYGLLSTGLKFVKKHWLATTLITVGVIGLAISFILPKNK